MPVKNNGSGYAAPTPEEIQDMLSLEKPIFIENAFVAPFYNEETERKIRKAENWIKQQGEIKQFAQYMGRKVYSDDTNFKRLLLDFLEESICLNHGISGNALMHVDILEATNCTMFVTNPQKALDFFDYYVHLLEIPKCYEEAFDRKLSEKEVALCEFLGHDVLLRWLSGVQYHFLKEII